MRPLATNPSSDRTLARNCPLQRHQERAARAVALTTTMSGQLIRCEVELRIAERGCPRRPDGQSNRAPTRSRLRWHLVRCGRGHPARLLAQLAIDLCTRA